MWRIPDISRPSLFALSLWPDLSFLYLCHKSKQKREHKINTSRGTRKGSLWVGGDYRTRWQKVLNYHIAFKMTLLKTTFPRNPNSAGCLAVLMNSSMAAVFQDFCKKTAHIHFGLQLIVNCKKCCSCCINRIIAFEATIFHCFTCKVHISMSTPFIA